MTDTPENQGPEQQNEPLNAQDAIAEILTLLEAIPPIESENSPNQATSTSLDWLYKAAGKQINEIKYPRLSVFAGNHGFSDDFPSDPHNKEYVNKFIANCQSGSLTLNRLAEHANCDLRLYELTPAGPEQSNILKTKSLSMSTSELSRALAYGMISVEPEIDLYATAAIGAGSEASAKAIIAAHTDKENDDIRISALRALNSNKRGLESLQAVGGPEIAAICGAIIAARLGRIPLLLEGPSSYAALLILQHHCPHIGEHCALTGYNIEDDNELTFLPAPYNDKGPQESGSAAACLIAGLKNEIILDSASCPTN